MYLTITSLYKVRRSLVLSRPHRYKHNLYYLKFSFWFFFLYFKKISTTSLVKQFSYIVIIYNIYSFPILL